MTPAPVTIGSNALAMEAQPLLADFDIAAEGGWNTPLLRTFTVSARAGVLDLHVQARVGRGLLNQLRLLRDGRELGRLNCGCDLIRSRRQPAPTMARVREPRRPLYSSAIS